MPVAATFHTPAASGDTLAAFAEIDTMVGTFALPRQACSNLASSSTCRVVNLCRPGRGVQNSQKSASLHAPILHARPGRHDTPRTCPRQVTVVDAAALAADMRSGDSLADRALGARAHDARAIADLVIDQIEFASTLVLNKCDLVTQVSMIAPSRRCTRPFCHIPRTLCAQLYCFGAAEEHGEAC